MRLRVEKQRYDQAVLAIQRWTRAMKELFEFLRLKRNVLNVQRKWKEKYAKKTKAVLVLQNWTHVMKPRFDLLVKKRELAAESERMRIQRERELKAAVALQNWTKSMKARLLICIWDRLLWMYKENGSGSMNESGLQP